MESRIGRMVGRTLLAAAVSLAALGAAATAQAADTVRLGKAFAGSFYYGLADVGKDAGIFEKHGIDLQISSFGGGAKLQQALAAGAVDVGLSGGTDLHLTAKGAPMTAVGVGLVGVEQVAIVAPDSKLKSVDDIKGTRWPAPSRASMPGWLPVAVAMKMGWGADGVNVVPGPPPDQAIALIKRGELDAMPMDPTSAAQLQAKGEMRVLFDFNDYVENFLQYAVFANDDFRKAHPDAVKNFLAAWYETIAWAQQHKDETVASMAKAINVSPEIAAATYDRSIKNYPTDGHFDAKMIDNMKSAFMTAGFLDKEPDMSKLYTEEYLPK